MPPLQGNGRIRNNSEGPTASRTREQDPASSQYLSRHEEGLLNGRNFPCRHPHNHLMSDVRRRGQSFLCWPGNVAASANEMAEAGLYYTGTADKTKCFYCGGGLQDWEYLDDPLVEHAKWFPDCEYLLRKKGIQFVLAVSEQFPELSRPGTHICEGAYAVDGTMEQLQHLSFSTPQDFQRTIDFGSDIGDYSNMVILTNSSSIVTVNGRRVETQQTTTTAAPRENLEDKVRREMRGEMVENMLEVGFQTEVIKTVLSRRLLSSGMFSSLADFVDAVHEEQRRIGGWDAQSLMRQSTPSQGSIPPTSVGSENEAERRIREIQNEQRCKICLDQESSCVFHPCNHLCACLDCGAMLTSCPICRQRISRILRVYKS